MTKLKEKRLSKKDYLAKMKKLARDLKRKKKLRNLNVNIRESVRREFR
jgi:hypothetical protein